MILNRQDARKNDFLNIPIPGVPGVLAVNFIFK